ncbi:MAG: xanthine dehydrogenase family protein molybdopterin-binding subunit [Burkholderiales bacterium]|nr:xanthine dehydrogenase family protein molybdopterin-binding subunit [Burkholderiales bacterium]
MMLADSESARDRPRRANRLEDARLVTGAGRYAADWRLPGMLAGVFVRSDRAHARLVALDSARAAALPGVHAVLTGSDAVAAGYVRFYQMMSVVGLDGRALVQPERPVLAHGRVRYVGEPLALIVADSEAIALDAAEHLSVSYEDLPVVVGARCALAAGAPVVHAQAPGNLAFDYALGNAQAVAAAIAAASHVTLLSVESTRVAPNPLEPRACLAHYDAAGGGYTLHLPVQGINMMRLQMATLTGVAEENIRIVARDVGGSFGQRSQSYPEYAALMLAARRTGRPVKWVSTRSEGFLADTHGRAIAADGTLALDASGRFLALSIEYAIDLGAYPTPGGPASHLRNPVAGATGVYRIPAVHARLRQAFTNTVPVASYRGAGRPDCVYAIERLVDQAAFELALDPAELRRRNFIPLDAFPYRTPSGVEYERCDFAGVQQRALDLADHAGFERRRARSAASGMLRGIGTASAIEVTWAGVFPKDQVRIEALPDGSIDLVSVTHSSGQGHETVFAQIAADVLGIAHDRVRVRQSVSDVALVGNHTGGSRSALGAGSACRAAAKELLERARALAADVLQVEPSQVDARAGCFVERESGRMVDLGELAAQASARDTSPLALTAEVSVGSTFPNTCHVAEVEIDPHTGVTRIVGYTVVDDCGTVLNRAIVEGQVHGALVQGLGQVFGEHVAFDPESGQLASGSLLDYFLPRAGWLQTITHDERPIASARNPLGAKGVGEGGCVGALPAAANAVMNALRPAGVLHLEMPMSAARVWQALRAAGAAGGKHGKR